MIASEQVLRHQIARLEAELDQCRKERLSDLDDLRRDWETQLRIIWAGHARRETPITRRRSSRRPPTKSPRFEQRR
jgi:hypothetical protein